MKKYFPSRFLYFFGCEFFYNLIIYIRDRADDSEKASMGESKRSKIVHHKSWSYNSSRRW